jgi:hypothetical protein
MTERTAPISSEQVQERIAAREPIAEAAVQIEFVEPVMPPRPGVRVFPAPIEGTLLERPDREAELEQASRLSMQFEVGVGEFNEAQRKELAAAVEARLTDVNELEKRGIEGYLPDHLPLNPSPPKMDSKLRVSRFFNPLARLDRGQHQATTIFPPENRRVFSDTSFPWSTVGRVSTSGGWGTGTLVGPRHLLCASHMMT